MDEKRPQFQAIQTKYDGHHFRSRLEARWAVFFNALDIEYHYEPEGYSLEGTPYLPDFYLPAQDCFIEIKGITPTYEEKRKARLLASLTLKPVFIFYGPVGLNRHAEGTIGFTPPLFYTGDVLDGGNLKKIDTPDYLRITHSKLDQAGLVLDYDDEMDDLYFVASEETTWVQENFTWNNLYQHFTDRFQDGIAGIELLRKHHDEMLALLRFSWEGEQRVFFVPLCEEDTFVWCICPTCKKYGIAQYGFPRALTCKCYEDVPLITRIESTKNHRDIIDAYEKARSARFEFRGEA